MTVHEGAAMNWKNIIDNFKSRNGFNPGNASNGICSEEHFQRILRRERARSDRYGSPFSMLVFDLCYCAPIASDRARFIQKLVERIRPTDEIGWFRPGDIGIILPNTLPSGALKLSEDICSIILNHHPKPMIEIYTYPRETSGHFKKDSLKSLPEQVVGANMHQKVESGACSMIYMFERRLPFWKRMMDIVGSLAGLILLSPVFLVIAAAVKIASPGPIFFRQERVGHMGKPFICYKFRTMKPDSDKKIHHRHVRLLVNEEKPLKKLDNVDPRIFPLGKFLRKSSLDELPQLFNILRGDMSIVGPRPEIYDTLEVYQPWQTCRFDVTPGLTGAWQVNGKNRTTFKEMMRLDIDYIKKRSFWGDAKIILKTFKTVFDQLIC